MDITETINLLQSQARNKSVNTINSPARLNEREGEETGLYDIARTETNTDTVADTVDAEQEAISAAGAPRTTGEQFSTFLTLLTAQIKNQDPLAPLDSTQFVEQLATFTNLEFQATGNQSLELIAALLARQIELLTPTDETDTTPDTTINTAA